jgi:hypothetical protein
MNSRVRLARGRRLSVAAHRPPTSASADSSIPCAPCRHIRGDGFPAARETEAKPPRAHSRARRSSAAPRTVSSSSLDPAAGVIDSRGASNAQSGNHRGRVGCPCPPSRLTRAVRTATLAGRGATRRRAQRAVGADGTSSRTWRRAARCHAPLSRPSARGDQSATGYGARAEPGPKPAVRGVPMPQLAHQSTASSLHRRTEPEEHGSMTQVRHLLPVEQTDRSVLSS